eukprot:4314877-Amphidinium_carterae.1
MPSAKSSARMATGRLPLESTTSLPPSWQLASRQHRTRSFYTFSSLTTHGYNVRNPKPPHTPPNGEEMQKNMCGRKELQF